jgi:hypothetical protein
LSFDAKHLNFTAYDGFSAGNLYRKGSLELFIPTKQPFGI